MIMMHMILRMNWIVDSGGAAAAPFGVNSHWSNVCKAPFHAQHISGLICIVWQDLLIVNR